MVYLGQPGGFWRHPEAFLIPPSYSWASPNVLPHPLQCSILSHVICPVPSPSQLGVHATKFLCLSVISYLNLPKLITKSKGKQARGSLLVWIHQTAFKVEQDPLKGRFILEKIRSAFVYKINVLSNPMCHYYTSNLCIAWWSNQGGAFCYVK